MEYEPNKVYSVTISEVYKQDGVVKTRMFENTAGDGRKFKSFTASFKVNEFGDQWFSGFFNESKKTPGTPAIWEGMTLDGTITAKEKDGKTYYNFNKMSQKKLTELANAEKDDEIARLRALLEKGGPVDTVNAVAAVPTPKAPTAKSQDEIDAEYQAQLIADLENGTIDPNIEL